MLFVRAGQLVFPARAQTALIVAVICSEDPPYRRVFALFIHTSGWGNEFAVAPPNKTLRHAFRVPCQIARAVRRPDNGRPPRNAKLSGSRRRIFSTFLRTEGCRRGRSRKTDQLPRSQEGGKGRLYLDLFGAPYHFFHHGFAASASADISLAVFNISADSQSSTSRKTGGRRWLLSSQFMLV